MLTSTGDPPGSHYGSLILGGYDKARQHSDSSISYDLQQNNSLTTHLRQISVNTDQGPQIPSGNFTSNFCSDTSSERIVSRRGLRLRRQHGHKNFTSLVAAAASCWAGLCLILAPEFLGKGTQVAWKQSLHNSHCNMNLTQQTNG